MKTAYYKYRPLYGIASNGKREPHPFTLAIFQRAEIYFSVPKDFNDPFDCSLKLHARDSTDAQWETYLDELAAQYPDEKDTMRALKLGKAWLHNPNFAASFGVTTLRQNYEESSVFCLSKKANSIPMFSYYSDSHRGLALEFRFTEKDVPCGISYNEKNHRNAPYAGKVVYGDVEYTRSFPELNYLRLRGNEQLVRSLMFTKLDEWEHEDEFRIFRRRVAASAVEFDRRLLTRVIFGCKTTDDDVNLVRSWIAKWPSNVTLSKATPATDRFELEISDFDLVKGICSS